MTAIGFVSKSTVCAFCISLSWVVFLLFMCKEENDVRRAKIAMNSAKNEKNKPYIKAETIDVNVIDEFNSAI